jgi:putative transposase
VPTSLLQAPRANAICERVIGTPRPELLDKILMLNERHICRLLATNLEYINTPRRHRALAQRTPVGAETRSPEQINLAAHHVRRSPILDGLTNQYEIAA